MRRRRGELRRVFFLATVFFVACFFFAEGVLVVCADDKPAHAKLHSASVRIENLRIREKDRTTTNIYRRKLAPMIEASSSARLRTNSWLK